MKVVAIVQARLESKRFHEKVLKPLGEETVLSLLLKRILKSKRINDIVFAIPKTKENDLLEKYLKSLKVKVFRGEENDVLNRYYEAAIYTDADIIVRITGDCPFVDPKIVDELVAFYESSSADYVSNILPPTFPDGMDVEIFSKEALFKSEKLCNDIYEREHVTQFMINSTSFKKKNFTNDSDFSKYRLTLDEKEDYELITEIFNNLDNIYFDWNDAVEVIEKNPSLFQINEQYSRNEGSKMSDSQKLWKRAKKIIPGGNMLLSKRPEMYLPGKWPTYFKKTKGCTVWDIDNNKYHDLSIMGVGTNILGYSNDQVDSAVREVVNLGNMSTLNCPEEVYLSEKILQLHPWANMVRLARTGGEANAIAVRIARAYASKEKIAACGYHGWHDWYLAANLAEDDNLSDHLIPGLDPKGVPSNLKNSIFTFPYNDYKALEELVATEDIGIIKMEVQRNIQPKDDFLRKVRSLASNNDIILIFDECTSGFRETFGGLHKKYNVNPDIAIFGKALGNGYPITAIIGTKEIMNSAQNSFISSTFWSDRIGPTAALKTLEVMEENETWQLISKKGRNIKKKWEEIATKYGLEINTFGLDALCGFEFLDSNNDIYITYVSQEMLKNNFLASDIIYVSVAHDDIIIEKYFEILDKIFRDISIAKKNKNIEEMLESPIKHKKFERLN